MENKGVLSNLKFIFSAVFLFVLMFSAVIVTVLNMYKPTFRVSLGDEFIGYFGSQSEFEDVYNTLCAEKQEQESSVKVYLENEPTFETSYIRDSVIASQNIYTALREKVKTEYTIYNVMIQDEKKMTFASKDEATKYVADLKSEVPKVNCKVQEEKVDTLGEMTSLEVANNIFKDVVSRNKPVPVVKKYTSYTYTSVSTGASNEIANVAAAQGGIWPTTARYVSSPFGWRGSSIHTGIDIAGRGGDPIYAYKTGVVTFSGWGGAYGYMLKIDHGNGVATWYAHCSKLLVSAGASVNMGDKVALEGTTGNSTGNHLHFEIRINGKAVNPYPYIAGK